MTTANNPVVTAELLPCPFCGATMLVEFGMFGHSTAEDHGDCPLRHRSFSVEHEAGAWNTRAMTQASPPPDEMVERVASAIWDEHNYHYEQPNWKENGQLAKQHPDDIERAMRQARAALQSIGPMRGWGPIETAPKDGDGREIMVWAVCEDSGQGWCSIVRWHRDHWCGDEDGSVAPTHWMPLPNPPIRIKGQG